MKNKTIKIIIDYIYPPIPIRDYDFVAFIDGEEEGHRGYGFNEIYAVIDLFKQINEDENDN